MSADVVGEITASHASGMSMLAIANGLTERRVPTAQGGVRWHASTIKKVLQGA
ncbi:recombinase family protein [Arthrobacter sp. 92]|uniref:recombinase family protein n=1 Tax=Arthrobacter sp. 92 TaxID=3418175 RepID=UPI003D020856